MASASRATCWAVPGNNHQRIRLPLTKASHVGQECAVCLLQGHIKAFLEVIDALSLCFLSQILAFTEQTHVLDVLFAFGLDQEIGESPAFCVRSRCLPGVPESHVIRQQGNQ